MLEGVAWCRGERPSYTYTHTVIKDRLPQNRNNSTREFSRFGGKAERD